MKQLRDYQEKSIAMVKGSLGSGHKRPVLSLATGSGKTLIAANIVKGILEKGNRVIFVVPALSLINQTVAAFHAEGISQIGVIQGNHPMTNYAHPVQIASIQTVSRRRIDKLPHADLVIVDECHVIYKHMLSWMADWNAVPFVGLSATPFSRGLGKYYDDLIVGATTSQLIDQGYLSKFKVYAPTTPDLSKVRTVAGDYHEGDLSDVMDDNTVTGNVVDNWLRRGQNLPTLCFGVNRAHAKAMANEFESRGVPTAYIDAYTDLEERDAIAKQFKSGEVKVICNVGTMTTGVDLDVRCLILARPTKSESLFVQIIGRALRTAEGKDYAIIFDHTGTHARLGFVTDIHKDHLCDGKPKEKSEAKEKDQPLPKECGQCHFLKPAKVHECPACGHKPEKQSDIEHEEGELVELKSKKKLNRTMSTGDKKQFYGELCQFALESGYKQGWAANQYRSKFGCWPNAHKDAPLATPSKATLGYITSQRIAYSKRGAAA